MTKLNKVAEAILAIQDDIASEPTLGLKTQRSMTIEDIPEAWRNQFVEFFDQVHDDEELAAALDAEDLHECKDIGECFEKIGAARLMELVELCATNEATRLMVKSHSRFDVD